MENTPDKYCQWQIGSDYLEDALGQIHRNGSTVVAVVPYELDSMGTPISQRSQVITYIIIYYNPPIQGITTPSDGGDPATLQ